MKVFWHIPLTMTLPFHQVDFRILESVNYEDMTAVAVWTTPFRSNVGCGRQRMLMALFPIL